MFILRLLIYKENDVKHSFYSQLYKKDKNKKLREMRNIINGVMGLKDKYKKKD